ncbi:MAG TPA: QsdR family transcriptional regulator [Gaiellaceae bacterium]|nr:QsdR family transcriptional regulator [Gaiellaceae bacterium]
MYQYREMTETTAATARPRGRRPAASREDVLALALRLYLHGERVDVQAIAGELGLGRTTIYRWFGSREGLIGETVARAAEPLFDEARAGATGAGGAALLDTFDRINRALAAAPALRSFLELERDALRILTSSSGVVHRRAVAKIQHFVEEEVRAGTFRSPVEPSTLAYAIVRLAEAFLFNDATAAMRGDVDRLREIEAALLGVASFGPDRSGLRG